MSAGDPVEAARERLAEGDPEGALEILAGGSAEFARSSAGAAVGALAALELEDPRLAERILAGAPPSPEDPDWIWARAEIDLAHWRLDRAAAGYARLVEGEGDDPTLALRRSLLADLAGDRALADRELAHAAALDPEWPPAPSLDEDAFHALVVATAEALPPLWRERFEQVAVVVDPVPDRRLAGDAPCDTPPDALGLFVGTSDLDRHSDLSGYPGPVIYLFQRNLERHVGSSDELVEEVRITLLHELGHLLGFDEDGVDALGLA